MIKQKTKLLKREFADMLGCLPIVVSRLVKKGEVKVDVNGRIDIAGSEMEQYIKDKRLEIQQHKDSFRCPVVCAFYLTILFVDFMAINNRQMVLIGIFINFIKIYYLK